MPWKIGTIMILKFIKRYYLFYLRSLCAAVINSGIPHVWTSYISYYLRSLLIGWMWWKVCWSLLTKLLFWKVGLYLLGLEHLKDTCWVWIEGKHLIPRWDTILETLRVISFSQLHLPHLQLSTTNFFFFPSRGNPHLYI